MNTLIRKLLCLIVSLYIPCLGGCLDAVPGKTRALLIGIGKYKHAGFPSLYGTSGDIKMVENLLNTQFQIDNIDILEDQDASRKAILHALETLKSKTRPRDTVFIYFTGHGTRINDTNGDEADGCDEALVAYDYRYKDNKPQGVVSDDELARLLDRLNDRRVIMVMDCCHSGTTARSIKRGKYRSRYMEPPELSDYQPKFSVGVNPGMNDQRLPVDHIYFGAAQDGQKAVETTFNEDGSVHGVFTFNFVKGLQGDADTNFDGVITYREIYDYCKKWVSLKKVDQIPSIAVNNDNSLNQPFLNRSPVSFSHTGFKRIDKIRLKLEGVKKNRCTYRSSGFKIEFTDNNDDWDYLVKRRNQRYELYAGSGVMIQESADLETVFKYLDAAVLADSFKWLKNKNQRFNITVDAAAVGRYYFQEGECITYNIRAEVDCFLLWLNIDPKGNIVVLIPNLIEGGEKNFLKKGVVRPIPGDEMDIGFDFEVGGPFGKELFKLIGFKSNIDLKRLFRGCTGETTYFFSLSSEKKCNSWAFYRRLEQLLSHSSKWSETVIEIETIPGKGGAAKTLTVR